MTYPRADFNQLPSEGAAIGLFLLPESWVPQFRVGWVCDFYTRSGRKFKGEIIRLEGDQVTFKTLNAPLPGQYSFTVRLENRKTFVLG